MKKYSRFYCEYPNCGYSGNVWMMRQHLEGIHHEEREWKELIERFARARRWSADMDRLGYTKKKG